MTLPVVPGLILTMGSNPLPLAVVAKALKVSEVWLVTTPDVRNLANRLGDFLGIPCNVCEIPKGAKWDVARLRAALAASGVPWKKADLCYVGGTKLISAEVRAFWREQNPQGSWWYLSEGGRLCEGNFRNTGTVHRLPDDVGAAFTLDKLAALHFGGEPKTPDLTEEVTARRKEVARAIHTLLEANRSLEPWTALLPPIYWKKRKLDLGIRDSFGATILVHHASGHAANDRNFNGEGSFRDWDLGPAVAALGLPLLPTGFPAMAQHLGFSSGSGKPKELLECCKFLWSMWLEVWLDGFLAAMRAPNGSPLFDEVTQNRVYRVSGGQEFEADVLARRGHRVYLFSCTVDSEEGLCKSKLFEAIERVQRVGGEYARVGLVSLGADPWKVLRNAREDGWSGYDAWRVFGLSHVLGQSASCEVDDKGQPLPARTLSDALLTWVEV